VYINDIDMCCVLQGNKRRCDFNELIYARCGVPARQGVVPSGLGYVYICGNVVGEDDE
jgi:hypothetical protein